MDRNFYLMLAGVIGVLVIIFIAAGGKQSNLNNVFEGDPLVVQADDHTDGEGTTGVILIEYADFECPGCGLLFPSIEQLKAEYGDQITFVFRHFPLERLHPNALAAHRAAVAAGNQDMFWEMHDLLYLRQNEWAAQSSGADITRANALFETYAGELQLDIDQYKADIAAEATFNRISTQIDSGNKLGVNATPTLYLNGEQLETPGSYQELKDLVDAAINEAAGSSAEQPAAAPAG